MGYSMYTPYGGDDGILLPMKGKLTNRKMKSVHLSQSFVINLPQLYIISEGKSKKYTVECQQYPLRKARITLRTLGVHSTYH